MPRPLRIEYENAYYHVMNRGQGRRKIFDNNQFFELFLTGLQEANQRFGLQVLCYCLMSNHYHLLVKTPEANLGRVMRHINGTYTQRYNRLKKTDGALFRGRYKAICVEEDSYQLQLSRYIHRNPLEANIVINLVDYPWSSYRYYVKAEKAPSWLYQQEIYDQLSAKSRKREKYQAFVEMAIDDEIKNFYSKGNVIPYLGGDEFRTWAYQQRQTDDMAVTKKELLQFKPSMDEIIDRIARAFKVNKESILVSQRGRVSDNIPRWVAMYLAQERGGVTLREIAAKFGLVRTGSIPTVIGKLKQRMGSDSQLVKKVEMIKSQYDT